MEISIHVQGIINTLRSEIGNSGGVVKFSKNIADNNDACRRFLNNLSKIINEYKLHRAMYLTIHIETLPNIYLDKFITEFEEMIERDLDLAIVAAKLGSSDVESFTRYFEVLDSDLAQMQPKKLAWR